MSDDDNIYLNNGRELYARTHQPVWPRRTRELPDETGKRKSDLDSESLVKLLLTRLDKAETMNRPSLGEQSAKSKDLAAFSALKSAAHLMSYVAGWAIDHQIGTAIENRKFVPLLPSQTQQLPEYQDAREAVDSHRHEQSGGEFHYSTDTDPALARRIAINILAPIAGQLRLPPDFIDALKALDTGDVLPILEPANNDDKVRYTEAHLQLEAVALVEYWTARRTRSLCDGKKHKAQEYVAGAIHVGTHTLRGWESRLRSKLGTVEVNAAVSRMRNAAHLFEDEERRKFAGDQYADPSHFDYSTGADSAFALGERFRKFRSLRKIDGTSTHTPD